MISKAKSWLIRENQSALFHLSPQNSFQPLRQRHNRWRAAAGAYAAGAAEADRNDYEKIRSGKQEKPFHEIILQVGNKDDMSADSAEGRLAANFSADPEEILPEAGTLESAKSYR